MNEITTGCGPCPYCINGKCTMDKRCTHMLNYTTNTETSEVVIFPLLYMDDNIIYYNNDRL